MCLKTAREKITNYLWDTVPTTKLIAGSLPATKRTRRQWNDHCSELRGNNYHRELYSQWKYILNIRYTKQKSQRVCLNKKRNSVCWLQAEGERPQIGLSSKKEW